MKNALLGNPLGVVIPDELKPFPPGRFLLDSWPLEEFRRRFPYRYILTRKGRPLSRESFHGGRIAYEDRHVVLADSGPR
jgi:hypothetical protein